MTWLWLAIFALVCWGITGVTQKLSTNRVSSGYSFLWFTAAFLLLSGLIGATRPLNWNLTAPVFLLVAAGGLLNGLGALTSFAALESGGKSSIVIPFIAIYPLLTVLGAWLLFDEQLTPRHWIGIGCAIAAVILLSQESRLEVTGANVPDSASTQSSFRRFF